MDARRLGGTVVDGWLRVTRIPVDVIARAVPNGDTGPRNSVMLLVDRADATVRDFAGRVLRDEELVRDAERRRVAADERERAIALRVEAERKKREADAKMREDQRAAEARRQDAERDAQERAAQIEREKNERQRKAEETARQRRRTAEEERREKLEETEKEAKRERLRVLETEAEALDTEEEALTAADEAQRLRKAASAAKAARKRGA